MGDGLMACTREAPCGGVLKPDEEFNRAMSEAGITRAIDRCLNGHTHQVEVGPIRGRRGRQRLGRWMHRTCGYCEKRFHRYVQLAKKPPVTCSRYCHMKRLHRAHTIVTPAKILGASVMYATGSATPHIAAVFHVHVKTVETMLKRAGLVLRPYTSSTRCMESGCSDPPFKIRNGSGHLYGRRCHEHKLAHQRATWRNRKQMLERAA